ncbi:MAG: ferrochelatase [Bacteroidota bacterium]
MNTSKATQGVLLVNLGSPDSYEVKDVKRYLREFLLDGRVIDLPPFWRKLLVEGIVLRTRPPKSAEAYESIWWEEGSPLIVLSKRLQAAVQANMDIPVGLGMRYGNPSIEAGFQELLDQAPNLKEVLLVPLYPHYAMSSYETVVVKAEEVLAEKFSHLEMKVLPPFYQEERYLKVLGDSLKPHLKPETDLLLFSYHGVPERHLRKSDCTGKHCLKVENCCEVASEAHTECYRHQVMETSHQVAQVMGLRKDQYAVSFQSRLGPDPWLKPFTAKRLKQLPGEGVKNLAIACPAFVSDCLETLEEIAEEGKEMFMEAGGESFTMIPCLNTREDWAALLADYAREALAKSPATVA